MWSRGFLARSPPSVYMGRRLVPRGSVGRVTVQRGLEQRVGTMSVEEAEVEALPDDLLRRFSACSYIR